MAPGYVLGALDAEEMIAVQEHLDVCLKDHSEITELGGVLPYLAEALPPAEPPTWLRDSVIEAARADLVARRRVGKPSEHRFVEPLPMLRHQEEAEAQPVAARRTGPLAAVLSIAGVRESRRRRVLAWATGVAAAVAIVGLSGYIYVLQGDLDRARKANEANQRIYYYMGQADTRTGVLAPQGNSEAGGVALLRPSGSLIVQVNNLAPTKGDEVYVVWLVGDNGAQSKVGSFTVDDSRVGNLLADNVSSSASLWVVVSREPNRQITKPSGQTVVSGPISL
jgi:hypothetical protein